MSKEEQWLLEEKYGGVESDLSACGLTDTQAEAFHADLKRLADGEPLGYIIGHVPFLNCTIHLDSHPLIPRSETEFWVEKAIAEIQSVAPSAPRILDLCAGSGCIGVAVTKAIPNARVDFAEIDATHLPTIGKNLTGNLPFEWKALDQYQILQSNLFENIDGTYNFILTNPPYIDPALDRTETSVKNYEPHQALYGGEHGMAIIEKIINEAPQYLTPNGQLWIEHEPEQEMLIAKHAAQNGFDCTAHTDQYNTVRYSILVLQ